MDYTTEVSRYIGSTRFEDLTDSTVDAAKLVTLDLLGSALAGSTGGPAAAMIRYTAAVGGNPEATVIGSTLRTSCASAGFANGTIAADVELDDVHPDSNIHASSVFVPALLAICETRGASGRDYINGLVAAYDIGCRVSEALGDADQVERGFHPTAISGVFGSTAGAARVVGLSDRQTSEAIGLAASQASGLLTYKLEREHYTKSLHSGLAARTGLQSVLLIDSGFRGPDGALDGRANVFEAFSNGRRFEMLAEKLGERFEIESTGFKFYGFCRAIHATMDILLQWMATGSVTADDVAGVEVWLPSRQVATVDNNELVTHNMQYVLAVTLLDGGVFANQLSEDRRGDPRVSAMMARIRLLPDDEMNKVYPHHWPCRLRITTTTGEVHEELRNDPRGNPGNPASRADIETKFRTLVSTVLPAGAIDELVATVRHLDEVASIRDLTQLLQLTGEEFNV